MSQIAKSGYKAEEVFITCPIIKEKLELEFNKKIILFTKVHGQKYDVIITFDDNSIIKCQIKKIENLTSRGDSFDRRNVKSTFSTQSNKNDYFCIIKTDKNFINKELYIIKSTDLYSHVEQSITINICLKENGTCLHLSPNIYLQRKGGGSKDKNPDDIQAKIKITSQILSLCKKLM